MGEILASYIRPHTDPTGGATPSPPSPHDRKPIVRGWVTILCHDRRTRLTCAGFMCVYPSLISGRNDGVSSWQLQRRHPAPYEEDRPGGPGRRSPGREAPWPPAPALIFERTGGAPRGDLPRLRPATMRTRPGGGPGYRLRPVPRAEPGRRSPGPRSVILST